MRKSPTTKNIFLLIILMISTSSAIIEPPQTATIQQIPQIRKPFLVQPEPPTPNINLRPTTPLKISQTKHCSKPKKIASNISEGLAFENRYILYTRLEKNSQNLYVYDLGKDHIGGTKDDNKSRIIRSLLKTDRIEADFSKNFKSQSSYNAIYSVDSLGVSLGRFKYEDGPASVNLLYPGKDNLLGTKDDISNEIFYNPFAKITSKPIIRKNIISFQVNSSNTIKNYLCDVSIPSGKGSCRKGSLIKVDLSSKNKTTGQIFGMTGILPTVLFEKFDPKTFTYEINLLRNMSQYNLLKDPKKSYRIADYPEIPFYLFFESSPSSNYFDLKIGIPGRKNSWEVASKVYATTPQYFPTFKGVSTPSSKGTILFAWEETQKWIHSKHITVSPALSPKPWREKIKINFRNSLIGIDDNTLILLDESNNYDKEIYSVECH